MVNRLNNQTYNMEKFFFVKRPQPRCVREAIYKRRERSDAGSKHPEEQLKSSNIKTTARMIITINKNAAKIAIAK